MSKTQKAPMNKVPTLANLARQADPFQSRELVLQRLKSETSESKYLEWKQTPPVGPTVSLKTKYRVVKAVISFANTDGGFVVFGIGTKGEWLGFTRSDLLQTDAAALAELINGCISPEIIGINYGELEIGGRLYPVLHIPPSPALPHVTTKDIQEKLPDGQHVFHINRYAIYCRYTAKSDLATPTQIARIIAARTDYLKAEMLRRVKEIKVPIFGNNTKSSSSAPTILRMSYASNDPALPAVRITRDPTEAAGIIVQEELSEAIFDEINNVVAANKLLARNRQEFVLGQELYYQIYAERQHVGALVGTFELLASAATKFYAPGCYWFQRISAQDIAEIFKKVLAEEKSQHNRLICRLAILFGPKTTSWLKDILDLRWAKHSQPAQHYFTFKDMLERVGKVGSRLAVLQVGGNSEIELPAERRKVPIAELLKSSHLAGNSLSKACMAVCKGDKDQRSLCRLLDVAAYGADLKKADDEVFAALKQIKFEIGGV